MKILIVEIKVKEQILEVLSVASFLSCRRDEDKLMEMEECEVT